MFFATKNWSKKAHPKCDIIAHAGWAEILPKRTFHGVRILAKGSTPNATDVVIFGLAEGPTGADFGHKIPSSRGPEQAPPAGVLTTVRRSILASKLTKIDRPRLLSRGAETTPDYIVLVQNRGVIGLKTIRKWSFWTILVSKNYIVFGLFSPVKGASRAYWDDF